MFSKSFAIALVLSSAALAAPSLHTRQNSCQDTYNACIAAGTAPVACSCDLTACRGEDAARLRSWCASATANLPKPTSSATPITTTSTLADTTVAIPTFPPAPSTLVPAPTAPAAPALTLVPVEGKTWLIANLTRYCNENNTGCDYNFAVSADGKTERCTVVRMPGSNAASESWSSAICADLSVSWGYVAEPGPAFAVITVVKGRELAWFGVPDINGGEVTPGSPFGSGDFGTLPPGQVYIFV
ncbi:hypothetical protein BDW02DRAFT_565249 [Decorospora gaudefroyi]|uniref:Extracellular membrane protein CFEM domain-containing protein n=1 Tax=Decorospora gaudefroyi TaxID=184978 RepID=A0A6A5KSH5_9PLEO|nr:hypothetical protein BDW02DRAFT_565249 [Decorospora gaudefroyi]